MKSEPCLPQCVLTSQSQPQSVSSLSPFFHQSSVTLVDLAVIVMTVKKVLGLHVLRKPQITVMMHMQNCAQLPTPLMQMWLLQF